VTATRKEMGGSAHTNAPRNRSFEDSPNSLKRTTGTRGPRRVSNFQENLTIAYIRPPSIAATATTHRTAPHRCRMLVRRRTLYFQGMGTTLQVICRIYCI
jgi:hypothetical protein